MPFDTHSVFSRATILGVALLLATAPSFGQTTYYVDASTGSDAAAGTAWNSAFRTLTKALDVATGSDEIWIATGVYYPDEGPNTTDNDAASTFHVDTAQNGIKIYGGFANGDAFADRNPSDHPVVLSGDLEQNDLAFAPLEDTDNDTSTPAQTDHFVGTNAEQVIRLAQEGFGGQQFTRDTRLEGFSITGGDGDGGLLCDGDAGKLCNPTLVGLAVYGNFGSDGAGVYNDGGSGESSPLIVNTVIAGNAARNEGGGMYNNGEGGISNPTLVNVTMTQNTAFAGGGMLNNGRTGFNPGESEPLIVNTIVYGNTSGSQFAEDEIENSFASTTIRYSMVRGIDYGTNVGGDPLFIDTDDLLGPDARLGTMDDGLRLADSSPAIDAGSNDPYESGGAAEGVTSDLTGVDRTQDDSGTTTATVDIGAYEGAAGPIPVELTTFSASRNQGRIELAWRTASETNNAGFHVERKVDDGSFSRLGFVSGNGTTAVPQSYRFADRTLPPTASTLTYRLRQVDVDGTESLSAPVTVALRGATELTLGVPVPHPVGNRAVLQMTLPVEATIDLQVFDLLGRQVGRLAQGRKQAGTFTVPMRADRLNLTSGVYFVRLTAGGQSVTQRVTVVR